MPPAVMESQRLLSRTTLPRPVIALEDALAKLATHDCNTDDLAAGDKWELGEGLGLLLLATPSRSSQHTRLAATATSEATSLPSSLLQTATDCSKSSSSSSSSSSSTSRGAARVALCDFLARRFHNAVSSSPRTHDHGVRFSHGAGQYCLETNHVRVLPDTGTVHVVFELVAARGRRGRGGVSNGGGNEGKALAQSLRGLIRQALLRCDLPGGGLDARAARAHVECIEDQRHLRGLVASSDGIAFIANGAVLPRKGGGDDAPMAASQGAVPFVSPPSLQREFELPHGGTVAGMLLPRGVTVIVGGGYHGKSTLLRALAVGVYDKVPGDGRELAVTDPGAVTIRAEDGRPVSGVDISPFISELPTAAKMVTTTPTTTNATPTTPVAAAGSRVTPDEKNAAAGAEAAVVGTGNATESRQTATETTTTATAAAAAAAAAPATAATVVAGQPVREGSSFSYDSSEGGTRRPAAQESCGNDAVTTECFSTGGASGSTSQAANVMEALEAGATALLLDEDTCAGNFMIRDSRMRAMVHHEPITPFIYRVSSLWLEMGVSSVIVVGGCGDYFDVHNTAILVDNYVASDATERAHSISRRFCVGRVQYAGRGLVHRLPWPEDPLPRAIVAQSILRPTARSATKRKHNDDNDDEVDKVDPVANGNGTLHHQSTTVTTVVVPGIIAQQGRDGVAAENGDTGGEGGGEPTRELLVAGGVAAVECGCPCYCGGGGSSSSAGRGGRRMARVGKASADLSRVEQLVGGAAQVRGCALGVEWIARAAQRSPGLCVSTALDMLDAALREGEGDGLQSLAGGGGLSSSSSTTAGGPPPGGPVDFSTAACGPLVARPRRFEVAAALHRLPGVQFERSRRVAVLSPEVAGVGAKKEELGAGH